MGPMEGAHSPIFVPVANERRMSNAQGVHPPTSHVGVAHA